MWSSIPSHLSPYILKTPWFSLHWYGLMYVIAYIAVYTLARYRMRTEAFKISASQLMDALIWSIFGIAVGARLFYVFFYDPAFYLAHPAAVIWPVQNGELVGIAGLSFHGGFVGCVLTLLLFCRKYRLDPWMLGDLLIPLIPVGLFFGRIGNFINGELYGRVTSSPLGMFFRADATHLRHPSQLYEACLEGGLLFVILWVFRKRLHGPKLLAAFLAGYGVLRFVAEFFRQPDPQIGFVLGSLSLGQIFSALMIFSGLLLLMIRQQRASFVR